VGWSLQLRGIEGRHHDAHEKHRPGIRTASDPHQQNRARAIRTPINAAAWKATMRLVPHRRTSPRRPFGLPRDGADHYGQRAL
jgi:hypothetical protein